MLLLGIDATKKNKEVIEQINKDPSKFLDDIQKLTDVQEKLGLQE